MCRCAFVVVYDNSATGSLAAWLATYKRKILALARGMHARLTQQLTDCVRTRERRSWETQVLSVLDVTFYAQRLFVVFLRRLLYKPMTQLYHRRLESSRVRSDQVSRGEVMGFQPIFKIERRVETTEGLKV